MRNLPGISCRLLSHHLTPSSNIPLVLVKSHNKFSIWVSLRQVQKTRTGSHKQETVRGTGCDTLCQRKLETRYRIKGFAFEFACASSVDWALVLVCMTQGYICTFGLFRLQMNFSKATRTLNPPKFSKLPLRGIHVHWRRIGIRPELSGRIAIHFNGWAFTLQGMFFLTGNGDVTTNFNLGYVLSLQLRVFQTPNIPETGRSTEVGQKGTSCVLQRPG